MAIKFLSDVVGSGELEGNTLDVVGAATFQGVGDTALILSSGDVIVGGSHGNSGQVLTSNGENNSLSWTNKTTNSNDFLTGLAFNTTSGVLTATVANQTNPTVDLDGRYLQLGGGTMTGNIQITSLSTVSASSFIGSVTNPIVNIYATSVSGQLKGTIASTVTGTTQSQDDNSTKIATTAYVDTAISEIPAGNDTTYDLTTLPSGSTGLRLDPSSGTNDDITFTGTGGLTITRNSATQLTFDAPAASSTPTLAQVTSAGSTTTNAITVGTITNNGSITTSTTASVGTNLTVLGNSSLVSLDVGGGFGSTGVTISSAGNISANGTITGNLTGNVTGNVTGDVTGDITGNVTGNVTGNLTGNVTGDVAGDLNGTINTSTTATTQSQGNNSTKVATTSYVDTAVGNIPSGLSFEGNWNASTDSPSLAGTTPANGVFYIVSVAGNTNLDGITDWVVGDWAVYVSDGAGTNAWQKIDNTSTLGGAGTSTKIAKWSGTTSLADSTITDDGTDVSLTGDLTIGTNLTLTGAMASGIDMGTNNITNLTTDNNNSNSYHFLVMNGTSDYNGDVKARTKSQVRGDIGAGTGDGTVTSVAALTLGTTGTDLSSTVTDSSGAAVITLNVPTASANNRGALSSTDWSTFNSKTSNTGTITSVGSTSPITGSASSGGVTIGINTADTNTTGALTDTDWNTFNGKMPLNNITSNYDATGSKAFIAVGVSGNSNALTYSTDMYYVAGSPSALYSPSLQITNSIVGGSLTISGTSALDTITSDKDITFTTGTSGGTGLVYDATLGTDGTYSGEVAYFGNSTSTNQGRLYQLQSTGGWAYADADLVSSSSGLLAVALGSNSDDGMLLRGFIRDSDYSALDGTAGAKLYVNTTTTSNSFTADIPTGTNDIVRIVGYVTASGAKTIYFCPDNTFIQLA